MGQPRHAGDGSPKVQVFRHPESLQTPITGGNKSMYRPWNGFLEEVFPFFMARLKQDATWKKILESR